MASPSAKRQRRDARRRARDSPRDSLSEALRSSPETSISAEGSMDEESLLVTPPRHEYCFSFMPRDECQAMFAEGREQANEALSAIARRANRKQTNQLMGHQSKKAAEICRKIDERADQQEEQNDRLEKKLDRVYESNQKILANQERDERRRQRMERAGGTRRKLGFDDATPGPKSKKRKVEDAKSREERIAARKAKADRDHCERNARTRSRA